MFGHNYFRLARFAAENDGDGGGATGATGPTDGGAAGATGATDGEAALGDAGKKALEAMKVERKAAKDEAAAAKAERDALQAKLDGKEAEHAAQKNEQRVKDEALAAANARIIRSEVKAAAKGVLADPQDAYSFLDMTSFEVDENGNVDEDAIADALKSLVAAKPYLSAQGGQRFQGGADGGARNGQVNAIDKEIADAEARRDFQTVIALKQRRAAELAVTKKS